ncbi:MAG: preprotein translocase subunit SecA [Steroidobacteraceae bacterium]
MWKLLTHVFGSRNQRLVKELSRTVAAVNALESSIGALPDTQFPEKTRELKARCAAGTPLTELVPEAFALVREASRRKLGLRHFDVQLIGGLALHQGKIAEMRTGEGKTLMSTLPAYLNALSGEGVHVVTVNEYLAQRDADWMGPVFRFLGLEVGVIKNAQSSDEKRAAYACDVTYGTNNEFGFDYLRDNLAFRLEDRVQRKLSFAIVDEVDSILIDEARTPLIISGPAEESTELYIKINALIPRLTRAPSEEIVDRGVLVKRVDRISADLRVGDVILSVNGSNVHTADEVLAAINASKTPSKAKFELWRDRRLHTCTLDIAKHAEGKNTLLDALGIAARHITPEERFEFAVDGDYWVDEKQKQATLTEAGHQRVEELFSASGLLREGESLYDPTNIRLMHHLNAALRAHALYKRDVEYIVRQGEVIIVDEFTGRTMQGRRWSDGLHQAVEAKEGVKVREENQTVASITFQNYFRLYAKLSGMTGTADTEAFEFQQIYGLEVVVIPTHKPMIRADKSDLVFLSEQDKFQAILEDIQECVTRGQPALVGTTSIETSERLAKLLQGAKIPHEVLNAKQHEREAHIVAEAGRPGAVTIATNMAGRGTDIVLGGSPQTQIDAIENPNETELKQIHDDWRKRHEQVLASGGLHIIGTERHESRRIDNQLRGRSGRQGDPGSSRFYLSLEDNLMRIFGDPTRMKALMTRVGMKAGEAIESGMLTRQIERAQRRVEQHNFDARKQLLEYDDVANDQRRVIYQQRTDLMSAEDVAEAVKGIREDVVSGLVDQYVPGGAPEEQWDAPGLIQSIERDFGPTLPIDEWLKAEEAGDGSGLRSKIVAALEESYGQKEASVGTQVMRYIEKEVMLRTLDQHWREHLAAMDYMRQGIFLRSYAQKNPKQEYKREAFELFSAMLDRIKFDTLTTVSKIQVRSQAEIEREELERQQRLARALRAQHAEAVSPIQAVSGPGGGGIDPPPPSGNVMEIEPRSIPESAAPFVRPLPKVGRNEPCPCGSGRKYKHCHGTLQQASG